LGRVTDDHAVVSDGALPVDAHEGAVTEIAIIKGQAVEIDLAPASGRGLTDAHAFDARVFFCAARAVVTRRLVPLADTAPLFADAGLISAWVSVIAGDGDTDTLAI